MRYVGTKVFEWSLDRHKVVFQENNLPINHYHYHPISNQKIEAQRRLVLGLDVDDACIVGSVQQET